MSEVFEIDLKDRTVFQVGNLITPRSKAFVLTDKKYIYCLGGVTEKDSKKPPFEKYDPSTKEWTPLAQLTSTFEPHLCINDKHFISVFSKGSASFMKYVIQDDRWVEEKGSQIPKDLFTFTNFCLANQSKFSILGKAVRETSNVEMLQFDHLSNKIQRHTQLSVLDSWLPIILVPNDNLKIESDDSINENNEEL